jgi:hypothetical protein
MTGRRASSWSFASINYQLQTGDIPDDPQVYVTVKEVVDTEDRAIAELRRLREVNPEKDVAYFYQRGRVLPAES